MLLHIQNTIPDSSNQGSAGDESSVAERIAHRALSQRQVDYADDIRRLLDAALTVMQRRGTLSRPRVADIVREAGVSNDAFYRYFPSKDALVAALLEDGTERLHGYLAHQMGKEATPEGKVRRWVEGVLSQADPGAADATLAVLFNAGGIPDGLASGRHPAVGKLAPLLHEPFVELGSTLPQLDASIVAHALLGRLADHLWSGTQPDEAEIDHLVDTCLAVAADR